ncbi:hypothetical protein HMPREF1529_03088 [Microbacterium sp. oral taxon 186 str. F0373]|uniref:hypothetical protein n=1 Tax=Microbacterium sp. oral taxon 186 TaxID=712383 RepID=UPI000258666B|nr:hypothetical protein [Microbacterium sp. oral taxon 186]EIC06719.1 hypothetical protein OR221_3243 [Microbacterium laevaniformans OR221]EPD82993.1 hypothetical protein HMPREF1529_03088 [Microbacterium sp. oral taxon 186 str. F0373]
MIQYADRNVDPLTGGHASLGSDMPIHRRIAIGSVLTVAATATLAGCAAAEPPTAEYVVGTWTCTQTGTTDTWDGGNSDGTQYRIVIDKDGTGTSQMIGEDGAPVNEEFPLTYEISGTTLTVDMEHFGRPFTVQGVPEKVPSEGTFNASLGGLEWLSDAFTADVKNKTVSGIEFAGAVMSCERS